MTCQTVLVKSLLLQGDVPTALATIQDLISRPPTAQMLRLLDSIAQQITNMLARGEIAARQDVDKVGCYTLLEPAYV